MRLRLPNDCFFDSQFISKSLIIKILTQIMIAKYIIIEETNEIPYTHIAYHRKHRDILYFLNSDTCICNQVTFAGYPCSHLIKLHEYLGNGFPMFLINSRWIKKELDGDIHNFTELNTEINSFNDDDIEVEID